MPPAHERLESEDFIRRQRDDRLIEEFEIAPLQGRLEFVLELQFGFFGLQNLGVEDLALAAAHHMRPVQRGHRVVQHILGVL